MTSLRRHSDVIETFKLYELSKTRRRSPEIEQLFLLFSRRSDPGEIAALVSSFIPISGMVMPSPQEVPVVLNFARHQ